MASIAKFDTWQNTGGVNRQTPLQVIQSTLTSQFETNATTVDFSWSVTITPSSSSNKILISMHSFSFLIRDVADSACKMWLERSIGGGGFTKIQSPANYLGQGGDGSNGSEETYPNMMFLDSPATTSAVTYKITGQKNGSGNGGNVAWNHNNSDPGDTAKKATLIAMEISQ